MISIDIREKRESELSPIVYSFCIRALHPDITEDVIRRMFHAYKIGVVKSIDFVKKDTKINNKSINMAFIHIEEWDDTLSNHEIDILQTNVSSDSGMKIYYDNFGHYFILRRNFNPPRNNVPINNNEQEMIQHLNKKCYELPKRENL